MILDTTLFYKIGAMVYAVVIGLLVIREFYRIAVSKSNIFLSILLAVLTFIVAFMTSSFCVVLNQLL
jgi:hypothetical protein